MLRLDPAAARSSIYQPGKAVAAQPSSRSVARPPVRPFVVEFGQGIGLRRRGTVGPEENLVPTPPSPRWVVSTGGPRGLVVVSDLPGVLVRVGGGWLRLTGATELVVPPVH